MKFAHVGAVCLLAVSLPVSLPAAETLEQRLAATEARLAALEHQDFRPQQITATGFLRFATETQTSIQDSADNDLSFRDALTADEWNNRRLTRAGLQLNARISDQAEAVVQVLSLGAEDYQLSAQWAFVGYNLTPDLQLRAGRIVLPLYLHSQYLNAGYTHPWIEMPTEVYGAVRTQTFEGIDLSWNLNTGAINHRLNVFWGNNDLRSPVAPGTQLDFAVRHQHGINLRSSLGDFTSWLSFSNSLGTLDLTPVGAGAYSLDRDYVHYISGGGQYDNGELLLMAEFTELKVSAPHGWFPTQPAGYLMAGYRFGKLMPHLTWGFVDSTGTVTDAGGEALYRSFAIRQKSWTLGARYDVSNGLAVKAEVSRYYDFSHRGLVTRGVFEGPVDTINCGPQGICAPHESQPLVVRLAVDAVF